MNKSTVNETEEQIRVKPYRDIIKLTNEFKCGTEFDDEDNLLIRYHHGEGSVMSDRINKLLDDKVNYRIKMLVKEQILKVKIGV